MVTNLTPHALLFTLSAIGISETAYLIRKRIAAQRPVCPIGGGCELVLTSRYNRMFGVHNDLAGMGFYLATGVLAALLVTIDATPLWVPLGIFALLGAATAASAVFTFIQWRVLRAWCFWCLMSAATIVLMDAIVLTAQLS